MLEALKAELGRFGATNDAATGERARRMLNITRDTGEFLSVLVRATGARRVPVGNGEFLAVKAAAGG
jgi:hypothetical protein